jgi:hypothetical protein
MWPGLSAFSALPDDLKIATTEVGYPAAMNPRKEIIDLAGLNHTGLALGRVSLQEVIRTRHPDVVYLPHPDYVEMNEAIQADPYFRAHYDQFASAARLSVAVFRESRYGIVLRAILASPTPARTGRD